VITAPAGVAYAGKLSLRGCGRVVAAAADPAQEALEADAKTAMRDVAEAPRVQVPLEELPGQLMVVDLLQQPRVVVLALTIIEIQIRMLDYQDLP